MYFPVISHLLCNCVTNKKVGCLDRMVWVRFVVDLLNEFYQIMLALIEK